MNLNWIVDRRGSIGSPIYQGNRPTCLSCATSSAHGSSCGSPRSIEYLYHMGSKELGGASRFTTVQKVLSKYGQPPEPQWPYDPTLDKSPDDEPVELDGPFLTADFDIMEGTAPEDLVRVLRAGDLPIVGIATTRRFMVLQNEVLSQPSEHVGRHAVLLVGAARAEGSVSEEIQAGDLCFLVQNSWGSSWGVDGFGLIAQQAWNDMFEIAATVRSH